MQLWSFPLLPALATLAILVVVAGVVPRLIPARARVVIPPAFLAGGLGLALGPSALDVIPVATETLEVVVYHSFGWMFIAVSLQAGRRTKLRGSPASLATAISMFAVVQALLSFGFLTLWGLATDQMMHPGFGWLVPLGFVGGPGQALALGGAWESQGLAHGGQIGLVFAALGFVYCLVFGVAMLVVARRRGWVEADDTAQAAPAAETLGPPASTTPAWALLRQLLIIGLIYAAVFGTIWSVGRLIGADSPVATTIWGFHFLVGAAIAFIGRRVARTSGRDALFHDASLARISVVSVEVTTIAALSAVRFDRMDDALVPILLVAGLTAIVTLLGCLWLARRAFPDHPFGHALVVFGASTGTLSTGLALLRAIDPGLRGPVARNAVLAATAAIPLGIPLFLVILPFSVTLWPRGFADSVGWSMALLVIDGVLLTTVLVRWTPFRLLRPLTSLWPRR